MIIFFLNFIDGASIEVTESNKREYVQLYLEWRTYKGVEKQMNEIIKGFFEIIPSQLLTLFHAHELEVSHLLSRFFFFLPNSHFSFHIFSIYLADYQKLISMIGKRIQFIDM